MTHALSGASRPHPSAYSRNMTAGLTPELARARSKYDIYSTVL
jgi:hypothetical protein